MTETPPDTRFLSYAQNMEDYVLDRIFDGRKDGFYIDVGGGHVVADNVSFHFYAQGWRGLVVEPQAMLAETYRRVRPRDVIVPALVGRTSGEATFFAAENFHGLSTTIAGHAETSARQGIASRTETLPMTTLAALCAAHAPARIDFLKIDVEGAEADVIAGNDWTKYRPAIVVVEAVTPWSMADASAAFEPLLIAAGYRFAYFDNLNRFYVAAEHPELLGCLPASPPDWGVMRHLGEFSPPETHPGHPDHALAALLPAALLPKLNTMSAAELALHLPAGVDADAPETRSSLARIAAFHDGGYVG